MTYTVPPGLREVASSIDIALQPIIDVATGEVFAYEALARFGAGASADTVLTRSEELGIRAELELVCARQAVNRRPDLPPGALLSVNISPDALRVATQEPPAAPRLDGVIVELTEHQAGRPEFLTRDVAELRARGALIAVDDVGSGYAGMLRLASLRPDIVKIDKSIVTGVRRSLTQFAVLEALVALSHRIGATVIAEGVESVEDLTALAELDVDYAQGWLIGRPYRTPQPIAEQVVRTCRLSRATILAPLVEGRGRAEGERAMHEATSLLGLATTFAHLTDAVVASAKAMAVDVVGLSMLDPQGNLRELVSSGSHLDTVPYAVADYSASRTAILGGRPVEVHLGDREGDPAEQQIMRDLGCESLLIVPVGGPGAPVGILEFFQRSHRRWTIVDVAQGRGLALHVTTTLQRIARGHRPGPQGASRPVPRGASRPVPRGASRPDPRPEPRTRPRPHR